MPSLKGVKPLVAHSILYEKELKKSILDPLFVQLSAGLEDAVNLADSIRKIDVEMANYNIGNKAQVTAISAMTLLNHYHRRKMIADFRLALGVNIRPVLDEAIINTFITKKVSDNVDLIKTIPNTLHDSLKRKITQQLTAVPFDQQKLKTALRDSYGVTGSRLKLITRDQTSKTIGNLSQIRQTQLGITEYRWRDSDDERVRDSHRANSGLIFRWDSPPSTGHPGASIQCRCVSIPVPTIEFMKEVRT